MNSDTTLEPRTTPRRVTLPTSDEEAGGLIVTAQPNSPARFGFYVACVLSVVVAHACAYEPSPNTRTVDFEVSKSSALTFDISPDGTTLIFGMLGQLWLLPSDGGNATPLTDAVRDTAQDSQPAFSPGGDRVVFRSDRPSGRGLWLIPSRGGELLRLTEGDDYWPSWSPDGRSIAFTRDNQIHVYDLDGEVATALAGEEISTPGAKQADWSPDGERLAAVRVGPWAWAPLPGPLWEVAIGGEEATLLTPGIDITPRSGGWTRSAWAPAYSPDGERIAYMMAEARDRPIEVRVLERGSTVAFTVASHLNVGEKNVRWAPDGESLYYGAEGELWKVDVEGGAPAQRVPFSARMSFQRRATDLRQIRFPEPGSEQPARGFAGLAISPSGDAVAMLALGRLWQFPIDGVARPVADVPATAIDLSWSPDGGEVAWSAGPWGEEDLFATDLASGGTRRLTDLPGREVRASHSPDGTLIAFVHQVPGIRLERVLVIPAQGRVVDQVEGARDLGPVPSLFRSYSVSAAETRPQWSPDSGSLLLCSTLQCARYGLEDEASSPSGELTPTAFLRWRADGDVLFVSEYTLWTATAESDGSGFGEPERLSEDAAVYPSVAGDGSILYMSPDGLQVRRPDGSTTGLGWPLQYRVAEAPETVLLRNARVIDGTGAPPSGPTDILLEGGRISRIGPAGRVGEDAGARSVDLEGRTVMPGLISVHDHTWDPALLAGLLYHGITTVRDPGSAIAATAGHAEMAEAGLRPAPRIVFSGFQLHARPPGEGGHSAAASASIAHPEAGERAVALAHAFGADHIKLRQVSALLPALRIIDAARRRGLPVSGHNVRYPSLVAAGMNGLEHGLVDAPDVLRMVAAAEIWVAPTHAGWTSLFGATLDSTLIDGPETAPFLSPAGRAQALTRARRGPGPLYVAAGGGTQQRTRTRALYDAGVMVGIGTDMGAMSQAPWEPHNELEEFVHSGFSPMEAIVAATRNGAAILGALEEIGTVEPGKLADLIVLDADPLEDIRNTRSITMVIQGGRVVDRAALSGWLAREVAGVDAIR